MLLGSQPAVSRPPLSRTRQTAWAARCSANIAAGLPSVERPRSLHTSSRTGLSWSSVDRVEYSVVSTFRGRTDGVRPEPVHDGGDQRKSPIVEEFRLDTSQWPKSVFCVEREDVALRLVEELKRHGREKDRFHAVDTEARGYDQVTVLASQVAEKLSDSTLATAPGPPTTSPPAALTSPPPHLFPIIAAQVSEIDIKEETPIGHGEVICLSVYCGPEVSFLGDRPCVWADFTKPGVRSAFRKYLEDEEVKKARAASNPRRRDGST